MAAAPEITVKVIPVFAEWTDDDVMTLVDRMQTVASRRAFEAYCGLQKVQHENKERLYEAERLLAVANRQSAVVNVPPLTA